MNAIIKLTKTNHEFTEKSICLHTIFGNVYAPISKIKFDEDIALVPYWIFAAAGFNPCQMVNGYIGSIN